MYPEIDNTGWKYNYHNFPERYESGPCWIVKTKRERTQELFEYCQTRRATNKTRELLKP